MTRQIYIVEDDDAVRASLTALVALNDDIAVRGFASAEALLADVDRTQPAVLLLDFRLPGASGLELMATLARTESRFVTVMLTGQGDVALAVRAMKAGVYDFLEKPVHHQRLLDALDAALSHMDDAAATRQAAARADERIAALSPRERDVLLGLIDGRSNKVIAHQLSLSPRTVEIHRARMMAKLDVGSLSEALRIAFAAGLVQPRTIG